MGTVSRFNLVTLCTRYGLRHFVETGTGEGNSLAFAASVRPGFTTLRSCDIESSLAETAKIRFYGDRRVTAYAGLSLPFLHTACDTIPQDEPILFWLDAHFPGADYGMRSYADEKDDAIRLPLAEELKVITAGRPLGLDVVAIDDARIYMDGPFGHKGLPEALRALCPAKRSIQFVHDIARTTHEVHVLFDHEGYLLLTPKESQSHAS